MAERPPKTKKRKKEKMSEYFIQHSKKNTKNRKQTIYQYLKQEVPKPYLGINWVIINDINNQTKKFKNYANNGVQTLGYIIEFKGCLVEPAGQIISGTHPEIKKLKAGKVLATQKIKFSDSNCEYIKIWTAL